MEKWERSTRFIQTEIQKGHHDFIHEKHGKFKRRFRENSGFGHEKKN